MRGQVLPGFRKHARVLLMSSENKDKTVSPLLGGEGRGEEKSQITNSSDIAIRVQNLSKCYQIYDRPHDRLKQSLYPRLQRLIGKPPKRYCNEFWALKNISFEVKKGETIGIVGKNGSGKSTLLQLVTGTLAPTTGTIEVNGRLAALLELGSGFNPEFTGRENVYLNGTILGLSNDEIDDKLDAILAFADIGDFIDQPVKTYSSGMYVRLAFAIQANIDPDILVVDEALAVGDAYFVHRCMLRFHDLQQRGCTIIVVSHDASSIKRLCRRVLWLDQGRLIDFGGSSRIVDNYLQNIFNISANKSSDLPAALTNTAQSVSQVQKTHLVHEKIIPNIDGRFGDGALEILGTQIYNAEGIITSSIRWNEKHLQLRVTLRNNKLSDGTRISVGYTFRDHRGIDLASTNSVIEEVQLIAGDIGIPVTINFFIKMPMLHSGVYSITPSIGHIGENGQITVADRISNALILEVVGDKVIFTPLRFPTKIIVQA